MFCGEKTTNFRCPKFLVLQDFEESLGFGRETAVFLPQREDIP